MASAWESPEILDMASLLMKINHEETKSTKVFLIFLRSLRFFVVDFNRFRASLIAP